MVYEWYMSGIRVVYAMEIETFVAWFERSYSSGLRVKKINAYLEAKHHLKRIVVAHPFKKGPCASKAFPFNLNETSFRTKILSKKWRSS